MLQDGACDQPVDRGVARGTVVGDRQRRAATFHFTLRLVMFRIDSWTTDNGLLRNSVTGLTKTPDGYIWLTTQEVLDSRVGLPRDVYVALRSYKCAR